MFNSDMASLKPTLYNAFMIAAIVIITIPLLKYAALRVNVPGLSPLIAAV